MKANQATHSVGVMCRVLNISRSGYYAWLQRPMSARVRQDLWLTGKIEAIHRRSSGAYGSPMIHAELADDHGIRVGRKRVAPLMRAAGLRGVTLRLFVVTTTPDPKASRAVDLVDRRFYAEGPDRLWVADITYVPSWSGFLYLAMVMDAYSRRIVGWAMETHLRTELILSALEMALTQRRPEAVNVSWPVSGRLIRLAYVPPRVWFMRPNAIYSRGTKLRRAGASDARRVQFVDANREQPHRTCYGRDGNRLDPAGARSRLPCGIHGWAAALGALRCHPCPRRHSAGRVEQHAAGEAASMT